MKVGRFGLGFKSVFHLTGMLIKLLISYLPCLSSFNASAANRQIAQFDVARQCIPNFFSADLPSVLSGKRLLILDPHEHFRTDKDRPKSWNSWDFEKEAESLTKLPDQFAPYIGMFECTVTGLQSGSFDGTLLRFPLRGCHSKSKLSKTIYDEDRIEKLFKCFEADAHLVPLFLKRVDRITLGRIRAKDTTPVTEFVVQIAYACKERIRKERATFLDEIVKAGQFGQQQNHITATYDVVIETVKHEQVTGTYHYLVRECYACGEVSTKFHNLREELEASYIPMVGVAMSLNGSVSTAEPNGQTFCVLPLPVEKKSSSGLPVHVNGFFSVGQNRRHLKWKTAGQDENLDKDVAWNSCLLMEVLPQCYADLIRNAIASQVLGDPSVSISDVYKAVPDTQQVDEKLKLLVEELFSLLWKDRCLYTPACGGKWVSLDESLLDESGGNKKKLLVRKVLLSMEYSIVTPPPHIVKAIRSDGHEQISMVTPCLIRCGLRNYPTIYTNVDDSTKMALLEFILQDEMFQELDGICLIPLEDGTFTSFQSQQAEPIYIPSTAAQRGLLLGHETQLLRADIEGHIALGILKVAEFGEFL